MRVGVVTFPGTLDDRDAARAVEYAGAEAVSLWHGSDDLKHVDETSSLWQAKLREITQVNSVG